MSENQDDSRIIVSYLTLRRVVGALGVLLPVLLAVGCFVVGSCTELQESISDYYATEMQDVFVGVLFAIGWFLFSYRGHDRRDDIAGDVACVLALCVALFPTTSDHAIVRIVHFVSATALFLVLSYFSLFLFTKSKEGVPPTAEKRIRNRIYVICGVTMLVCIAGVGAFFLFLKDLPIATAKPVFWLEAAALWAFGWSWFVKGETLWRDR